MCVLFKFYYEWFPEGKKARIYILNVRHEVSERKTEREGERSREEEKEK